MIRRRLVWARACGRVTDGVGSSHHHRARRERYVRRRQSGSWADDAVGVATPSWHRWRGRAGQDGLGIGPG